MFICCVCIFIYFLAFFPFFHQFIVFSSTTLPVTPTFSHTSKQKARKITLAAKKMIGEDNSSCLICLSILQMALLQRGQEYMPDNVNTHSPCNVTQKQTILPTFVTSKLISELYMFINKQNSTAEHMKNLLLLESIRIYA